MRVFVAGGSGAIGRRLVPLLVARGFDVTATTTTAAKLEQLRALGADAVVMDGLDAASVGEAVVRAAPDVIVDQMTALAGKPDLKHFDHWFAMTNKLRSDGTRHLLAAAAATDVQRFVAQSYTGWTNNRVGAALKTEQDPVDSNPAPAQVESLAAIQLLERVVLEAPLDGIVLRFGTLYGPGASDEFVELARRRLLPVIGGGGGVWSWIHVDDAASATVAALERGQRGVYNIVDDEPASVSEWLPYLARVTGAKPPRRLPAWIGRLAVGRAGVQWLTQARGASNLKAKRELGWRPAYPSWRQGFVHGLGEQHS